MCTGRRGAIAMAVAVIVMAGCGGGGSAVDDIVLDSVPATTTTTTVPLPATTSVGRASPVATTAPGLAVADAWEPVAGNLEGLESDCGTVFLASQPRHDLFLVNVPRHGLWSVTPGTSEWTPVGTGGEPVANHLTQLLVDPADPNRYWESGAYGGFGIYRTDDRGGSFEPVGDLTHLDYLSIDFADPERQTMLVGTHESPVLWLSTDGGSTWRDIGTLPPGSGFASSPYVVDATTFLVGTNLQDGSPGIFRSTDSGATWTMVHEGGVAAEPVVRDGTLYWLLQSGRGITTSTDGGATWVDLPSGAFSPTALQLVDMPDGSLVSISLDHVIRSTDGGVTWRDVGPELPYEPTGVAYSASEQAFYVARADCSFTEANVVKPNAIMRLAAA